ncbi:hypothetical protein ACOBQX_15325 [Actinokineospora sp. G85]|uniref:hypothetical protein n=1 Tax=Actinokineospora sp. G85 TaxID=3406626 RepID=UPI003C720A2A
MGQLTEIIEQTRQAAARQARADLRERLAGQPHDWLVDQLVDRLVAELGLVTGANSTVVDVHRVRAMRLDGQRLTEVVDRLSVVDRDRLAAAGALVDVPAKGGPLIGATRRGAAAEELLCEAKDLLYALLFGGPDDGVALERVARELLTLTVPVAKLGVFAFLGAAATEIAAKGTWRDPGGAAHDSGAANTLVQVEYGETADESVGRGIIAALKVINELEVNEQILYARMSEVEESTLI